MHMTKEILYMLRARQVRTLLHLSAQLAQLGADGQHALGLLDPPVAHSSDCCGTLQPSLCEGLRFWEWKLSDLKCEGLQTSLM